MSTNVACLFAVVTAVLLFSSELSKAEELKILCYAQENTACLAAAEFIRDKEGDEVSVISVEKEIGDKSFVNLATSSKYSLVIGDDSIKGILSYFADDGAAVSGLGKILADQYSVNLNSGNSMPVRDFSVTPWVSQYTSPAYAAELLDYIGSNLNFPNVCKICNCCIQNGDSNSLFLVIPNDQFKMDHNDAGDLIDTLGSKDFLEFYATNYELFKR